MKKLFSLSLAFVLVCAMFSGCDNAKRIIGKWELQTQEGAGSGITMTFQDDGTLSYGLDVGVEIDAGAAQEAFGSGFFKGIMELISVRDDDIEKIDETIGIIIDKLDSLLKIEYRIVDNKNMEITASMLFGVINHTSTVEYAIDVSGDTLTYDGRTYKRISE